MGSKKIDEDALKKFNTLMRDKLSISRLKGKHGWHDENVCSIEFLVKSLVEHLAKGDMVDVANFAMFINQRVGQKPIPVLTCTPTERAFLDEIIEKGIINDGEPETLIELGEWSQITQSDFTKSNLKELFNAPKTKTN